MQLILLVELIEETDLNMLQKSEMMGIRQVEMDEMELHVLLKQDISELVVQLLILIRVVFDLQVSLQMQLKMLEELHEEMDSKVQVKNEMMEIQLI